MNHANTLTGSEYPISGSAYSMKALPESPADRESSHGMFLVLSAMHHKTRSGISRTFTCPVAPARSANKVNEGPDCQHHANLAGAETAVAQEHGHEAAL